jgi:acetyl esterase/lipase
MARQAIPYHEMRLVYQVAGMETIQARSHVVCTRPDGSELTLDQYTPPGATPATALPAILFVHGGPLRPETAPLPKDWGVFISYGQLAAASGMAGFMFNHRYYIKQGEEPASEDIRAVMGYLIANAGALGIDASRLCVWVFSGGGKLLPAILQYSEAIKTLVLYYTLLDSKGSAALWNRIFGNIAVCAAKGRLDRPNINQSIDRLAERARAAQSVIEVFDHPTGRHGFDVLDDDPTTRAIIAKTIAFVKAHT